MLPQWIRRWREKPSARQQTLAADSPTTDIPSAAQLQERYLRMLLGDWQERGFTVPEKLLLQVIDEQCRDPKRRQAAVPRLPEVIPLLLKSLRDPDASASDYVAIIKRDPVLAAAVMKVANSAYFQPNGNVHENYERAVVALGIDGMRLVLSTAVMQPILHGREGNSFGRQVWQHALATAACCQQFAGKENVDAFKAYLLGLAADLGWVTVHTLANQEAREYLQTAIDPALLANALREQGNALSMHIAGDWRLPADIIDALAEQQAADAEPTTAYGRVLHRSQLLSETYLLSRAGLLDDMDVESVARALDFPVAITPLLERTAEFH